MQTTVLEQENNFLKKNYEYDSFKNNSGSIAGIFSPCDNKLLQSIKMMKCLISNQF